MLQGATQWHAQQCFHPLENAHSTGRIARLTRLTRRPFTARQVRELGEYCWEKGLDCDTVSGDRTQEEREAVIRRFRSGDCTTLIATVRYAIQTPKPGRVLTLMDARKHGCHH